MEVIFELSRLNFCKLYETAEAEFWGIPIYPKIPSSDQDISYQVKSNDRIDNLAYKFYSEPLLWWVIAFYNNLDILPLDLKIGNKIQILSIDRFDKFLFKEEVVKS